MKTIYIAVFEGRMIGSISPSHRITTSAIGENEEIAKADALAHLSKNNEIYSFISIESAASIAKKYDASRKKLQESWDGV